MEKFTKNNILSFIPEQIVTETKILPERIFEVNNYKINKGTIVYLIERELRANDNHALNFATDLAKKYDMDLILAYQKINYKSKFKNEFISKQLKIVKENFNKLNINLQFIKGNKKELINFLNNVNASVLIIDFNPILKRNYLKNIKLKIFEIDGHNIVPARFLSDKQEYNASTFRRKFYKSVGNFLTEFKNEIEIQTEAQKVLDDFILEKLPKYNEFKNNPTKNVLSGLSKYLNLGFISAQRVALEVIKSNAEIKNKESFLEELLIRGELSDNFCLYCKDYKSFSCIPNWAKMSINSHKNDFRPYIYTLEEFEKSKTHDKLWNSTQTQLREEGIIHGYLRMYWAKKIAQWSNSTPNGLKIAMYLNDKYALDSPSANGYTGILWAIGALHDRPFRDVEVSGKIRNMTSNGINKKFKISEYIKKYENFSKSDKI